MNAPRYSKLAARLLNEGPDEVVQLSEAARARAVARIAATLTAKTRRRARRAWALGLGAAIVAGLLSYAAERGSLPSSPKAELKPVSAVVLANAGGATILSQGATQPLASAATLSQGGRLIADARGSATVRLSSGTELSVEHDSDLEFENAGPVERFFLGQGVLRAKVAKLKPSERFVVRTPDAEVEVRGTTFRVEIVEPDANCAAGARTRVVVNEGLVEVRGAGASTYVHSGETWPAGCAQPAPRIAAEPSLFSVSTVSSRPARAARDAQRQAASKAAAPAASDGFAEPSTAKESSSIAVQNELFAEAAAARRRGDTVAALSAFELLISRYPASPLAESAAVQRMNLLQSSNPAAAKSAARQYLARYPRGYARSDAENLLAQP